MFDTEVFTKNLRQLMKDRHIKTKDLAKVLHITPPHVSHFLVGRQLPRIEMLYEICELFDVSMDWICGRDK